MRTARFLFLVFLIVMVGIPVWWYTKSGFVPQTTLVRGGLLLERNGQTSPGALRLRGERILEIGNLSPLKGETVVDATGHWILPGFVEFGHDPKFDAALALKAGITTVALPERRYFTAASENKSAVNVSWIADYFEMENEVLKNMPDAAITEAALKDVLNRQLQLGALGIYFDLRQGITPEQRNALHWLAPVMSDQQGQIWTRLQGAGKDLWDELESVIKIAETHRVPLHLADLQLASEKVWNRANHVVARLDKARAIGAPISLDINPLLPLQPSDLQTFLADERAMVSTSWALQEETVPASEQGAPAPELAISDLVQKRSLLAADLLGLKDRGRLAKGAYADFILVRADGAGDLLKDISKFPQSISQVWVNGNLAFDGQKVEGFYGKALFAKPPANLSE